MSRIIMTMLWVSVFLQGFAQTEFRICLFDTSRNRVVPVTVYLPQKIDSSTKPVVFNHGYDGNKNSRSNETYSYLTRFLSQKGFYVISIQHELAADPPLAMEGDLAVTRMPNWKRGEENILFTIRTFEKRLPGIRWDRLILIGHSNGGDMAMLCATEHPGMFYKVISLDHRRMPVPRTPSPRLFTIRGCDYDADPEVLPTPQEKREYGITVVKLENITHSDMGEKGSDEQHDLIKNLIYDFIRK